MQRKSKTQLQYKTDTIPTQGLKLMEFMMATCCKQVPGAVLYKCNMQRKSKTQLQYKTDTIPTKGLKLMEFMMATRCQALCSIRGTKKTVISSLS